MGFRNFERNRGITLIKLKATQYPLYQIKPLKDKDTYILVLKDLQVLRGRKDKILSLYFYGCSDKTIFHWICINFDKSFTPVKTGGSGFIENRQIRKI